MNLTLYSDYALRVLMYLTVHSGVNVSIKDIARYYNISKDHLVKVVHHLSKLGYIKTTRGRGGGIRLAHAPRDINVGKVLRATEPNFNIAECFAPTENRCRITAICNLQHVLADSRDSFLRVLDGYTLEDLLTKDHEAFDSISLPETTPSET